MTTPTRARTIRPASARAFRRRSVLDGAPGTGGPNMTPMVDITLVILIFFMASATIAGPEWFLHATLPGDDLAAEAPPLPSPVVRVEVFVQDGAVTVRGLGPEQPLDGALAAVEGFEEDVARGLVVEIEAADEAPYPGVVRLHSALVARGVEVRIR